MRTVKLSAAFWPERLGGQATIQVGFRIFGAPGAAPGAVTAIRLLLPAGLGAITSDLGLETCSAPALERLGSAGCPVDSLMGRGSALTEVPFGAAAVSERVRILLFAAPLREGRPQLLFYASGQFPVIAAFAFGSSIASAAPPFGSTIDTLLPLVPSVPDGPDVALVALDTTIGPAGIVYSERVKGKLVRFAPRGILLPRRCPRGGFPFAIQIRFQDGSQAQDRTAVPCPGRTGRHRLP
jgi:hypothetical protein